jgi:hypothetical protein
MSVADSPSSPAPRRFTAASNAQDWAFLEEGGDHAVFRYAGAEVMLCSSVLRFYKGGKSRKAREGISSRARCDQSAHFAATVVARLVGAAFVPSAAPCAASAAFVATLNKTLRRARSERTATVGAGKRTGFIELDPAVERGDTTLEPSSPPSDSSIEWAWGLLVRDCTAGGYVSFEIKPKCGFTPSLRRLTQLRESVAECDNGAPPRSPWPATMKAGTSRYAMHQHLKLARGSIDRVSAYDPLDLFSNEGARVRRALDALVECPQNNWRVWRHGERVFAPECDDVTRESLGPSPSATAAELDTLSDALLASPLLPRLRAMQMLDCRDIEGLICSGVLPLRDGDASHLAPHALIKGLSRTLREVQQEQQDAAECGSGSGRGSASASARGVATTLPTVDARAGEGEGDAGEDDGTSAARRLALLRGYMLAAVAKDCSIMVTLR